MSAEYCFTLVDIGDAGRHSDGRVFSNSELGKAKEAGELSLPEPSVLPGLASALLYMFVVDAAFPLKTYLLHPYPDSSLMLLFRFFYQKTSAYSTIVCLGPAG